VQSILKVFSKAKHMKTIVSCFRFHLFQTLEKKKLLFAIWWSWTWNIAHNFRIKKEEERQITETLLLVVLIFIFLFILQFSFKSKAHKVPDQKYCLNGIARLFLNILRCWEFRHAMAERLYLV